MAADRGTIPQSPGAILALLFLILFIGVLDNQVILPVLHLIAGALNRTAAELGRVITAYAFAAGAMNLFFGPLSDHIGRRPVLILGLTGFGFCSYLLSTVSSYSGFLLIRTAMGVFAGILSTCVTAYVGDYFPYAVRGRAMGTVMASYFAALVVGVPAGAWIADRWGWQRIFSLTALLSAVSLAFSLRFLPQPGKIGGDPAHPLRGVPTGAPPGMQKAAPAPNPGGARVHFGRYRRFLGSPDKLAALLSGAFVSGATLSLLAFISPWLIVRYGMTASGVGGVFVVVGGAAVLASPLSGWFSDRMGKRRLFLISGFASAALIVLLPFAGELRRLMALFVAVALAVALRQTAQQALITEMTPMSGRGGFIALRNCFSQVGIGISVFIASRLFEDYGFQAVALFSAIQSTAAACLFYWVPEPGGQPPRE
ncbi:MAG: MFS transporter [Acidobacteria bacterium]|nr:MFS transporter [Acidobacteriota bacterium]